MVVYIFLLPCQTRWIYAPKYINGAFWEYGSASWYVTEIILWSAIIVFIFDRIRSLNFGHLFGKVHYLTHRRNLLVISAFLILLTLEILLSSRPLLSYDYIFRILEGICLLLMMAGSGNKKIWFYSFWSSAIVQGVFAIFQFFSQSISANKWLGLAEHRPAELGSFVIEFGDERWLRAYGSFGSPNILGGFLAVAFVFGLIMYLHSRPAEKIILTLGQSVILIGLILSFSRGAWLAAVVGWIGVGAYTLTQLNNSEVKFFQKYHLLGMYIKQCVFYGIVLGFLVSILAPLFAVRISSAGRLEQKSLSERAGQYQVVEKIIDNNLFFPLLNNNIFIDFLAIL